MSPFRKRSCLIGGTFGILLFLSPSTWAEGVGDLNGDGQVNSQDITLLEGYLAGSGLLNDEQIPRADINADGVINRQDLQSLKRRVEGIKQGSKVEQNASRIDLDSSSSGRVLDQKTGEPIPNAEVQIPEEGITVRTDNYGRFTLPRELPSDRILTTRASEYAPFSLTTRKDQKGSYDLRLEQLGPRLVVLDDQLHHLGDNNFSPQSANAGSFRLRAEGVELTRSFSLSKLPRSGVTLRIGSLIGLDTAASIQAGQSGLRTAAQEPLQVLLNGQRVQELTLNGDRIQILLPQEGLRVGNNTLTLRTGQATNYQMVENRDGGFFPLLGSFLGLRVGYNNVQKIMDYDDIELAHVTIEIPED
ncbi:MAG: dockerin type I domain-containing protein [Gloeobacterales cyanobacterium]